MKRELFAAFLWLFLFCLFPAQLAAEKNLAVVDQSTTLGIVEGDLKGSVAATILNVSEGADGAVIFSVQHHFVTNSGDVILTKQATAITTVVAPGLYAVLSYPVQITGGTGKYAGATGEFDNIGAADLNTGERFFAIPDTSVSPPQKIRSAGQDQHEFTTTGEGEIP